MKRKQRKQQNRKGGNGGQQGRGTGKLLYLTVIGILVAALVAVVGFNGAGFGGAGGNPAPEVTPRGMLSASSSFHNFGTVSMGNGKVSHAFRLENTGGEAALIRQLYTSCMCTSATLVTGAKDFGPFGMPGHGAIPDVNQVVEPGQAVSVLAEFDPNAHGPAGIGRNDRVVAVKLGNGEEVHLKFTAYVTP